MTETSPDTPAPLSQSNRTSPEPEAALLEMIEVAVAASLDPDRVLVEQVNWTVRPRDFWVIGGLAGAGKSDLLNTAAGLVRPSEGRVRLFGHEPDLLSEEDLVELRLRVGIVFGYDARLFNQLTVTENLALPLCYHRNWTPVEAWDRVRQLLEATGLMPYAGTRADQVPRYLRPRVGLARALILAPDLLLLDHPLAGMDPLQTRWWLDFLCELEGNNHPLLDNKRLHLVVATDNLRPWRQRGRQFAWIRERRWRPLGEREDLEKNSDSLLDELLGTKE